MTPPVEWCQKPGEKTNGTVATTKPAQLVKGIPPAGCSLAVGHRSGSGAFQHGKVVFLCVQIGSYYADAFSFSFSLYFKYIHSDLVPDG